MISKDPDKTLPAVLVGPILRRASPKQICLQLVSSRIVEYRLELYGPDGLITELEQKQVESLNYPLGSHCWLNTLIIKSVTRAATISAVNYCRIVKRPRTCNAASSKPSASQYSRQIRHATT